MVEIFRDQSPVRVGHYKSILMNAGILCMVKNETLALTEVPIPVFFPTLYVMNDDDQARALNLLREYQEKETTLIDGPDIKCPKCGELNPANFESCWSCEEALK